MSCCCSCAHAVWGKAATSGREVSIVYVSAQAHVHACNVCMHACMREEIRNRITVDMPVRQVEIWAVEEKWAAWKTCASDCWICFLPPSGSVSKTCRFGMTHGYISHLDIYTPTFRHKSRSGWLSDKTRERATSGLPSRWNWMFVFPWTQHSTSWFTGHWLTNPLDDLAPSVSRLGAH